MINEWQYQEGKFGSRGHDGARTGIAAYREGIGKVQRASFTRPTAFLRKFLTVPILLSLAAEMVLKAWRCREGKAKPIRSHDLLGLFNGLEPETQKRLEAAMPPRPSCYSDDFLGPDRFIFRGYVGFYASTEKRSRSGDTSTNTYEASL